MSVSPQRSAEMMVNGEATSVSDTSASAIPEVTRSSPWKKPKQSSSTTDSEISKQIMTQPTVTHSAYVPSQLERHLEFMHFNSGKISFLFNMYILVLESINEKRAEFFLRYSY